MPYYLSITIRLELERCIMHVDISSPHHLQHSDADGNIPCLPTVPTAQIHIPFLFPSMHVIELTSFILLGSWILDLGFPVDLSSHRFHALSI